MPRAPKIKNDLNMKPTISFSNKENKSKMTRDTFFSCWLPEQVGFICTFLLRRFFSGIRLNTELENVIGDLPKDAIIVYGSKIKSKFEYLCYYTRFQQEQLPYPQLGFDLHVRLFQPFGRLVRIIVGQINYFLRHFSFRDPYQLGFVRDEFERGTTSFLALLEKRDSYRRLIKSKTDPIAHLIDIQQTLARPICIIPQLMFFSKQPESTRPGLVDIAFGSPQNPGMLRRLFTLFKKPENIFIEVSDPVNLKQYINAAENRDRTAGELAWKLRNELVTQINSHRKSITGPTIQTQEELKHEILTSKSLREFMESFAKRRDVPLSKVHQEALKYIEEIAANFSPSVIKIAHRVSKHAFNTLFESVTFNYDALTAIKKSARKGPIIFMPAHKSHLDSLLLSYTLYDNDVPCPHVFAGINLAFWPIAPLLRRFGAFFVRRSFKGAVFYAKVFAAYIFQVLKDGFNIAVYIEGTRSRSGKLLQPQLGMLSILLNAYFSGACKEMHFVPVFISYDRIPDEGAYIHEISGGKKSPENFRQLIKAKNIFNNRYGRVHLNFGLPIAISDILEAQGMTGEKLSSKQQNSLCREIGGRVMNAIDHQALITPQSLTAGALLADGKEMLSRKEIDFRVEAALDLFCAQNECLAEPLCGDIGFAVDSVLHYYWKRKFIQWRKSKGKKRDKNECRIIESRRNALDYYKNLSISHFVPPAFTAMAILEKDAFQFSATDLHHTFSHLQSLFCEEFTPNRQHPPAFIVRKTVKMFIDNSIIVPHPSMPDTYNLSSEGYRKIVFFARYIEPFIESYRTSLVYFAKNRRNRYKKNKMLKKMIAIGYRMHRQGEIRLRESISKANYNNAITFFSKMGIRGSEDDERVRQWNEILVRYQGFINR
jgi:glycerol-3-phosphate O-acyltransferase